MPLYFAYGSNMNRDAMADRCPSSRAIGLARLVGHRLVVMREGYLSVARDPRRTVWGLLWDLSRADVPLLDRYEDVAGGLYAKRQFHVLAAAGPRRALVYVGRNAGPGVPLPGYMDGVLAAARREGFPESYMREIERLAAVPVSQPAVANASPQGQRRGTRVRAARPAPLARARTGLGWSSAR